MKDDASTPAPKPAKVQTASERVEEDAPVQRAEPSQRAALPAFEDTFEIGLNLKSSRNPTT